MIQWKKALCIFLVLFLASSSNSTAQSSFSCRMGTEPACLDYAAVVCNSSAKCVARDAECFSSFTCDYNGFICKSEFNEAVAEIDEKVRNYNSLIEEFNSLNANLTSVKADYDSVVSEHDGLQRKTRALVDCISGAESLEDAQGCDL